MDRFDITIWGARGSVPVSGPDFVRYGGNTSCLEVRLGDRVAILDAGTGIVPLGQKLREEGCRRIDLILSHGHYDHVIGLPSFAPLHDLEAVITIWHASGLVEGGGRSLLGQLLRPPFLPFSVSEVAARLLYRELPLAGEVRFGTDSVLQTELLNHPGGNLALGLKALGRRFVYAGDFEHDDADFDDALVRFLEGADLALLDCTDTASEYPSQRGFGHAHWEKSVEIAARGGVSRLVTFHHHPRRTDAELDVIGTTLSNVAAEAVIARQGAVFDLGVSR